MSSQSIRILIVDDDPALLGVLEMGLSANREHRVVAESQAPRAVERLNQDVFDLVITDYSLSHDSINGLEILRQSRAHNPNALVIIITAFASLELTLESIHLGVYDFLTKPFQLDELKLVVRNATDRLQLDRENKRLREELREMAASFQAIEQEYSELEQRYRLLDQDESATEAKRGALVTSALDEASVAQLRQRRLREQLAAYTRISQSLGEKISLERQRIEQLVDKK